MERELSDMMFLLFIREYRTIGLPARIRDTLFNIASRMNRLAINWQWCQVVWSYIISILFYIKCTTYETKAWLISVSYVVILKVPS